MFPQQRAYRRGCGKRSVRWFARDGVAYRASSGPTVASTGVGARSIFSTPAASGNRPPWRILPGQTPRQKASPEQQKQYKQYKTAVKQKNLSRNFVQMGMQLRADLDQARRESSLCG